MCMSLCHSLVERMEFRQRGNIRTTMCMGGIRHALSKCLLACGIANELHQSLRVLLLFMLFCIWRQVCRPPYGARDYVPRHVCPDKGNSAATQGEGEDEADVCAFCCQKHSTITGCGECQEHYCEEQRNVLMPTFVGNKLVISHDMSDTHEC